MLDIKIYARITEKEITTSDNSPPVLLKKIRAGHKSYGVPTGVSEKHFIHLQIYKINPYNNTTINFSSFGNISL